MPMESKTGWILAFKKRECIVPGKGDKERIVYSDAGTDTALSVRTDHEIHYIETFELSEHQKSLWRNEI